MWHKCSFIMHADLHIVALLVVHKMWCGLMPIWCFSSGSLSPLVRTAGEPWCRSLGRIQPAGTVKSAILSWSIVNEWNAYFLFMNSLLNLQLSYQPGYERFPHYAHPPSPDMSSYFSSGPEASSNGSLPSSHLNRVRHNSDLISNLKTK